MFVLNPDAKNSADRLPAHRGPVLLAVLAVHPRRHQSTARLSVCKQNVRQFSDGCHVQRAQCASTAVRDERGIRIDLANLAVPQSPKLEQSLLLPHSVIAASGVLWIVAARQIAATEHLEVVNAMFAVAHAGASPAIAENAVYFVLRDDLLSHLGHEFEIVRAQRARHPKIR